MGERLPSGMPDLGLKVYPFTGGRITLPEKFFVSPAEDEAKTTVPSLAFLIEHPNPPKGLDFLRRERRGRQARPPGTPLRIMFDLGLRSSPQRYLPKQEAHLRTRTPLDLSPGTAKALEAGGLGPDDIDVVIFSHVHYDHHGDPEFFSTCDFVIGHGAWNVLKFGLGGTASHQIFQSDLLPEDRTTQLPDPSAGAPWKPLGLFPHTLDLLGDGSLYLVDSPGHLHGHVNMLLRMPEKWLYFAGDTVHDWRLLRGEREIGTWLNDAGETICIHVDRVQAAETIARLRKVQEVEGDELEVILAHDPEWAAKNAASFYPNHLL